VCFPFHPNGIRFVDPSVALLLDHRSTVRNCLFRAASLRRLLSCKLSRRIFKAFPKSGPAFFPETVADQVVVDSGHMQKVLCKRTRSFCSLKRTYLGKILGHGDQLYCRSGSTTQRLLRSRTHLSRRSDFALGSAHNFRSAKRHQHSLQKRLRPNALKIRFMTIPPFSLRHHIVFRGSPAHNPVHPQSLHHPPVMVVGVPRRRM